MSGPSVNDVDKAMQALHKLYGMTKREIVLFNTGAMFGQAQYESKMDVRKDILRDALDYVAGEKETRIDDPFELEEVCRALRMSMKDALGFTPD